MQIRFPGITEIKDHIIAAFLLIVAVGFIVSRHQGGLHNLRTVSVTVFSYLEEPLSNIRTYRQALRTNTYLRQQNVLLLDELSRLRSAREENEELRQLLEFSRNSNLNLYPVQIVGKELSQVFNSLTIDAGTEEGITAGMPLVAAEGLAGKVVLTDGGYSQVMPIFNSLFKVSAKLQNSGAYGIVSWDSKNIHELQLNYVPQTVEVDSGEVVITSGYSNQFPPDIPIGEVIRTEHQPGRDIQKIIVNPFADIYSMTAGFVVKFQPDTTIQKLNEQYQNALE
jgi:rod shape-determining protein MreC